MKKLLLILALSLSGCATYTGCNEPYFLNLPGCPPQPVKLNSCQVSA